MRVKLDPCGHTNAPVCVQTSVSAPRGRLLTVWSTGEELCRMLL